MNTQQNYQTLKQWIHDLKWKMARYVTNSLRVCENSLVKKNNAIKGRLCVGVNYHYVVLFALLFGHGRLAK